MTFHYSRYWSWFTINEKLRHSLSSSCRSFPLFCMLNINFHILGLLISGTYIAYTAYLRQVTSQSAATYCDDVSYDAPELCDEWDASRLIQSREHLAHLPELSPGELRLLTTDFSFHWLDWSFHWTSAFGRRYVDKLRRLPYSNSSKLDDYHVTVRPILNAILHDMPVDLAIDYKRRSSYLKARRLYKHCSMMRGRRCNSNSRVRYTTAKLAAAAMQSIVHTACTELNVQNYCTHYLIDCP